MTDAILQRLAESYAPAQLGMLAAVLIPGLAVFMLLERLFPARPWSAKGYAVNLRCTVAFHLLWPIAAVIPVLLVYQLLDAYRSTFWPPTLNLPVLAFWLDAPPSPVGYRPSVWAAVAFTILGFAIVDFFYYWMHRLQHTPWLWEQHKQHHRDRNVNAAATHHFLEETVRAVVVTLPMGLLLNFTAMQVAYVAMLSPLYGQFIHANVRLNMGWFTPIITGPQLHRLHHSIEPEHRDKNFAAYFPLWDILFGTYYRPKRGEFPATGVPGLESVTWREMLIGPFEAWFRRPNPAAARLV